MENSFVQRSRDSSRSATKAHTQDELRLKLYSPLQRIVSTNRKSQESDACMDAHQHRRKVKVNQFEYSFVRHDDCDHGNNIEQGIWNH